MKLSQYQIVVVNLDPTVGREMKKTRPCIILSPDEMNQYLSTVMVAPITSQSRDYPTRVEVNHASAYGWIVLDQIRTVDKQRIVHILDHLTADESKQVKAIIREMLVD